MSNFGIERKIRHIHTEPHCPGVLGGSGGGGRVGGVRVYVNKDWSFCENSKKQNGGGGGVGRGGRVGGSGMGGQGGCERSIEFFVKIQKNNIFGGFGGFGLGWGARSDVNEKLKFLWKFKKNGGGGGRGAGSRGGGVGFGGGSGWMWTNERRIEVFGKIHKKIFREGVERGGGGVRLGVGLVGGSG